MKINAIIERGSDGLYSVYSEDRLGTSCFGGFGDSVAVAKEDFLTSVMEAISEQLADGKTVPSIEDIEIEYHYDIPSFFNFFDFINVSKFAEYAGVNESKMRAYKSGVAFPGEKTMRKICKAVKTIGAELTSVSM